MSNAITDYIDLPLDADFLATLISLGELNGWQLESAIKKIAQLDPKTRSGIWITLQEDMTPADYNEVHALYVRHCLKKGWSVGRSP